MKIAFEINYPLPFVVSWLILNLPITFIVLQTVLSNAIIVAFSKHLTL